MRRQAVPNDCTFFDTAYGEDNDCEYFANLWGITVADFIAWVRYKCFLLARQHADLSFSQNPSVAADCSGITVGREYCIERNWGNPVPTTTTRGGIPKPTSTVPLPAQAGIIDTCTSYYKALDGDDCSELASRFSFTLADFIQWNPAVDETCAGFWLGYYYCVAIPNKPASTLPTGPAPTATVIEGTSYPLPPSPTGTGTTAKCKAWYVVQSGDTYVAIAKKFSISKTQVNI